MPQTANEAWVDAMIRHQIGLQRIAPGIQQRINALLNASEADVREQLLGRVTQGMSTSRLDKVLQVIEAARSEAWRNANKEWLKQLTDIAKAEPKFMDTALSTISPVVLNTSLPSVGRLASLVTSTPFQGRILQDWSDRQQAADLDRIEQGIQVGLAQGQTTEEIAGRIVGTDQVGSDGLMQITRNNASAITRTAINAIANAAQSAFVEENSDVFDKEIFIATLDSRTTILCASQDHKVYNVGEGPTPPLHWNCRSLRVPLLDGQVLGDRPARNFTEQQLLSEFTESQELEDVADRSDLPRGFKTKYDDFARARKRELTGTVPATTSYSDWLGSQSSSFQDDILGPTRAEQFRTGEKTLDQFVNPSTGKLYTLDQLHQNDEFELEAWAKLHGPTVAGEAVGAAQKAASAEQMSSGVARAEAAGAPSFLSDTRLAYMEDGVPNAVVNKVVKALDNLGWSEFFDNRLEGAAAPQVRFYKDAITPAPNTNGRMAGKQGIMELRTSRLSGVTSEGFSFSEGKELASDKLVATATHEFGHAVHLYDKTAGGIDEARQVSAIVTDRFKSLDREFLTKVASVNEKEYFAEAFSAFSTDPEQLLQRAPKAYHMVEAVLEARGFTTQ